jgi:hypothetical protein
MSGRFLHTTDGVTSQSQKTERQQLTTSTLISRYKNGIERSSKLCNFIIPSTQHSLVRNIPVAQLLKTYNPFQRPTERSSTMPRQSMGGQNRRGRSPLFLDVAGTQARNRQNQPKERNPTPVLPFHNPSTVGSPKVPDEAPVLFRWVAVARDDSPLINVYPSSTSLLNAIIGPNVYVVVIIFTIP